MDARYIKEYYHLEREHWWFLVREQIILQAIRTHVAVKEGFRILNVGAAAGRSSQTLQPFGQVISVEYEPEFYEFLRAELGLEVVAASITDLPFADEHFDLVCAFDVVEHVEDHHLAAQELARVCRRGGTVLLTVPAFQALWGQHDVVNHHYRRYDSRQLLELFDKNLELSYSTYFNSLLFIPIWLYRVLSRWLPRRSAQGSGSDFEALPPTTPLNQVFHAVFSVEVLLLRWLRMPFGVSLLHLYRKP